MQMRSSFPTEQKKIAVISRKSSQRTARSLYVIQYIRFMQIQMLWQDVQVHMMLLQEHGVMSSICLVQKRRTSHRRFRKRHRISFICASQITRQVLRLQKNCCRNGQIMQMKSVQSSFMMQLMRHIFQKKKCRILSMNVTEQEPVQSRSEVSLKMQDLQACV